MNIKIDSDKKIKRIEKYLFFYRSFLFKFTTFEITSKMFNTDIKDFSYIVNALNIKNRKERITYVYEVACTYIDEFFKGKNLCKFINGKCLSHRNNKKDKFDGCCRMCEYKTQGSCPTKNIACKLFYCSSAKENNKIIEFNDIKILKVLTKTQRFILKSDYFSLEKDVILDLYYGPLIAPFRIMFRFIKKVIKSKIKK